MIDDNDGDEHMLMRLKIVGFDIRSIGTVNPIGWRTCSVAWTAYRCTFSTEGGGETLDKALLNAYKALLTEFYALQGAVRAQIKICEPLFAVHGVKPLPDPYVMCAVHPAEVYRAIADALDGQ